MDIDSAASTPILQLSPDLSDAQYLRYELTALAYHLKGEREAENGEHGNRERKSGGGVHRAGHRTRRRARPGLGPGLRRDARRRRGDQSDHRRRRDARSVSRIFGRHLHPPQRERGRGRRPQLREAVRAERYDVIQASLVDTWAATAAGAYTLTENTLYTVEAFNDYLDHLTDDGVLTITRWVFDGLRLVSLAQAACESRGLDAQSRLAIIQHERVATFLLKKSPFTPAEIATPSAGLRRDGLPRALCPRHQHGNQPRERGARGRDVSRRLRAADHHERPAAVLRRLRAGHPADDRRPAVLLPHHQARESVPGRIRPFDAVRQRVERAADADGHFRRAGDAVRRCCRWRSLEERARPAGSPGSSTSARWAPASC